MLYNKNAKVQLALMHVSKLCPSSGVRNTDCAVCDPPQYPCVVCGVALALSGLVWRGQQIIKMSLAGMVGQQAAMPFCIFSPSTLKINLD